MLLRHFGSLQKLRAATPEEIAALPGFGARTAEAIVVALRRAGGRWTARRQHGNR